MHDNDTTKPVHFTHGPCDSQRNGWTGPTTADPDAVTCSECKPIADKHKRGAALQAFEKAEVRHRAARDEFDKRTRAYNEAADVLDAASEEMAKARANVVALLGGGAS